MTFSQRRMFFALPVVLALSARHAPAAGPAAPGIEFNRDIRPILSEHCFACHGPDDNKRKAGLRLDAKDHAFKPAKSGTVVINPGQPDQSEIIRRLTTADDDDRMPPAKVGSRLKPAQIDLFRRWIADGARYQPHWSFIAPNRPALPVVESHKPESRNPIDPFIGARLDCENLSLAPEADGATLIRRVTLDLTGLPPTPAEVDAFLGDKSPRAYEKVVDRLLGSPRYGERMALDWLDAARFADTHGYHIDSGRDMSPWRDWVIGAFNRNLPFDRFTIEQIAGDLLPNAAQDQRIASGFNRNHMINFEGGAIPEEYHTAYLVDRVNTTATVWLGLTIACAQCHDHKYDPLTQRDYYRLYAFFNSVPENGLDGREGNAPPLMKVLSPEQAKGQARLKAILASAEKQLQRAETNLPAAQADWERLARDKMPDQFEPKNLIARFPLDGEAGWRSQDGGVSKAGIGGDKPEAEWVEGKVAKALKLKDGKFVEAGELAGFERTQAFSFGGWVKPDGDANGVVIAKLDERREHRGYDLLLADGKVFVHLIHKWTNNVLRVSTRESLPKNKWSHVFATYDGSGKAAGVKIFVNGKAAPLTVTHDTLTGSILTPATLHLGKRATGSAFSGALDEVRIYRRALAPAEVARLANWPAFEFVRIPPAQRTEEEAAAVTKLFRQGFSRELRQADDRLAKAREALKEFEGKLPTTMVMQELEKPRDTFMLTRGQYDQPGEKITPGVPEALSPLPAGAPANRLGLAQWLVAPENPLTARVLVNHYWLMFFGHGLVNTPENFGAQGEWPSHPGLLDWLAVEFRECGWDLKALQRLIVTSATYRQSSAVSRELAEHDPDNRLHARGPRFRLPAEFLRDQALAVSGLLDPRIGGASVSPYQPPGLWEELMARGDGDKWTAQKYVQSHGPDLYRRSMYTFWKRTSPPASLATLDAPDREVCLVKRPRTNTPLQALTLLNDPTFVEASRKLAERVMLASRKDEDRLALAFRLATARAPKPAETRVLLDLYHAQLADYRTNPSAAAQLLGVGESPAHSKLDAAELAAWTMVSSAILNLDEVLTKG